MTTIQYDKSFASHEKAKYWSDKNNVKPENILNNKSQSKYWFYCQNCSHDFEISLSHINEGKWCPYCNSGKLCLNNDCNYCYNKSFASEEKSKYWNTDLNNNINPRQVLKNSGKKYHFNCDNCPHNFKKVLSDITGGHWCPYCCFSSSIFCDKINCLHCFEKSFASHKKSKFWNNHLNNDINPNKITKYTKQSYYFDCDKCKNQFKSIIGNVVKLNSWCPKCYNKTELKLYEFIKNIFSQTIHQYKNDWSKNIDTNRYLPFDFCIEEYKIIIELDGKQHFEQVMNWKTPEEQYENDKYKEKCANENGYSIIRLLQEDVFNDKYDWKPELINNIEKIKTDNIIQNIYMCKNNEYQHFN